MQERLVDDLQRVVSYIEAVFRTVLHRPPEIAEAEKYAKAIYDGLSPVDFFHIVSRCDERRAHAKLFAVPGSYQSPVANPAELQPYVRGLATAGPALAGIAIDRAAMIAVWTTCCRSSRPARCRRFRRPALPTMRRTRSSRCPTRSCCRRCYGATRRSGTSRSAAASRRPARSIRSNTF